MTIPLMKSFRVKKRKSNGILIGCCGGVLQPISGKRARKIKEPIIFYSGKETSARKRKYPDHPAN